ncbi:hypothetical protein J6TS7_53000 [Paenibacillus dendritiformis]|nr:hypothetical protein J6TS7_53000 [Paenibacillus dendritiformis]
MIGGYSDIESRNKYGQQKREKPDPEQKRALALHQSFYENFYPISLYICNLLNYIRGQK